MSAGRPKTVYDPEKLRRLHHTDGLTLGQIGERLGASRTTISVWMREAGIPVRTHRKPPGYWQGPRHGRIR